MKTITAILILALCALFILLVTRSGEEPPTIEETCPPNFAPVPVINPEPVNPPEDETVEDTPTPAPHIVPYDEMRYNDTTLTTVQDFLGRCPTYQGGGQCVSRSRYIAFEAKKHNLSISTCIIGGAGSAENTEKHQVNTFKSNGVRYYTSNFSPTDNRIFTGAGLLEVVNTVFSVKLSHLGARGFWRP